MPMANVKPEKKKTASASVSRTGKAGSASRSSSAAGRKTTGAREGSKKRKTAAKERAYDDYQKIRGQSENEKLLHNDICQLLIMAASVFILVNQFYAFGVAGRFIQNLLFGLFGFGGYFFGAAVLGGFLLYLRYEYKNSAKRKLAGYILLFLFLCVFFQLVSVGYEKGISAVSYYSTCAQLHNGGGLTGGALVCLFGFAFGSFGAWLITFTMIFISAILLTQKPLISLWHRRRKKVRSYRREIRESRRESELTESREVLPEGTAKDNSRSLPAKEGFHLPVFGKKENNAEEESSVTTEKIPEKNILPKKRNSSEKQDKDKEGEPFSAGKLLEDEETKKKDASKESGASGERGSESWAALWEKIQKNKKESHKKTFEARDDSEGSSLIISGRKEMTAEHESNKKTSWAEGCPEEPGMVQNTDTREQTRKSHSRSSDEEIEKNIAAVDDAIRENEEIIKPPYQMPPLELLTPGKNSRGDSQKMIEETARKLQQTFNDFGVGVTVTDYSVGPTVTRYELQPDHGVKVSRILSLSDDIRLALAAADIRIEAPVPGKAVVGIEVPNKEPGSVSLREMLESREFQSFKKPLAFAVGKDIGGNAVITDIAKMPHLLIAGATGSGKSVCINTLIMSILYKSSPEDVKMIMIDPKVVELKVYEGIPHLLIPVVTDAKKASGALNWAVAEMTERYQKFASFNGVRDIDSYNKRVEEINANPDVREEEKLKKLPRIVVIVDELADLMMVAPGEVEDAICRLAQLARAAGIHVIIATQRPSVNVVTGLIKANMPSRIALAVASGVDSRTILDMNGAEKLLGKGDMLFYPQQYPTPVRVQGCFVSDEDISRVVKFITDQSQEVVYNDEVTKKITESINQGLSHKGAVSQDSRDEYFFEAGNLIIDKDKASIGMLQRYFKIGFNRAARIMDQLAEAGVVGEEEGTKPRNILMSKEQFENMMEQGE